LFSVYNGEIEDMKHQGEGFEDSGYATAELTLFYNEAYYKDTQKGPDAKVTYFFTASHSKGEKEIESEHVEMPQQDVTQISDAGLHFIAGWEDFRGEIYNDQAGHATIGYGHLVHYGQVRSDEELREITEVDAWNLFVDDMKIYESAVNRNVTVPVNRQQFDALVSLVYNIGEGNFLNSSVLRYINAGDYARAAESFLLWNKITDPDTGELVVSQGLANRREAEVELFTNGIY